MEGHASGTQGPHKPKSTKNNSAIDPQTASQGQVKVDKEILYADRAQFLPWRPRLYPAAQKMVTYSALAQACIIGYGFISNAFPIPVIYGVV